MAGNYLNKRIPQYISTLFASVAIVMLAWTVCVNENLPPAGLETSQLFYLLFAASVASISAVIALICNRGAKLRVNTIDLLILLITIYIIGSALLTGANQKMLLVKIALLFSVYISIRILITTDKKVIHIISIAFLLLGIYQCALSAMQLFGNTASNHGVFTVTGSFHNPGPLGGFLSMIWGLALYNILKKESSNWWYKTINILSIIYIFIALLILPATKSRTAWIAAVITSCGVMLFLYGPAMKHWIKRYKILSIIASSILLCVLIAGSIVMYNMKKDSADGRLLMWKTTAAMIADHPVFGVGMGAYGGEIGEYQANYFSSTQRSEQEILIAGSSGSSFNEYLQCAAELGLIGLVAMLVIALLSFLGLAKGKSGLQFALLALAIFAMASFPLSLTSFGILGTIILAAAASDWNKNKQTTSAWITYCLASLSIMTSLTLLLHIYPLKNSYKDWSTLQFVFRNGSCHNIYDDYKELWPVLNHEPQFLFEYAKVLNSENQPLQSNDILAQAQLQFSDPMLYNLRGNNYKLIGQYNDAETEYYKAYNMVPNRIYPLYLLFTLYQETNQTKKMHDVAQRILNFKEKISSQAVQEIKLNTRKSLNND